MNWHVWNECLCYIKFFLYRECNLQCSEMCFLWCEVELLWFFCFSKTIAILFLSLHCFYCKFSYVFYITGREECIIVRKAIVKEEWLLGDAAQGSPRKWLECFSISILLLFLDSTVYLYILTHNVVLVKIFLPL